MLCPTIFSISRYHRQQLGLKFETFLSDFRLSEATTVATVALSRKTLFSILEYVAVVRNRAKILDPILMSLGGISLFYCQVHLEVFELRELLQVCKRTLKPTTLDKTKKLLNGLDIIKTM